MASHAYITTPLLPAKATRPPGPVTLAIRAVREAHIAEDLRRRLEERIEADLALLETLDGDPDLEPSLGAPDPYLFGGLSRDWPGGVVAPGEQSNWVDGVSDDREQDHGDEPEEPGALMTFGWAEPDVIHVRSRAR